MRKSIILLIFFSLPIFPQLKILSGTIRDFETKALLPNANVIILSKGIGTVSNESGKFYLEGTFFESDTLVVSYIGYKSYKETISKLSLSNIQIYLEKIILSSQTILIQASIGKRGITPIAFEKITRDEIQKDYVVQDIPNYLSHLPSTTFYSENGNGIGYNYLNIRGFDQRRISVSINGIPQNDPEDHNVYWLDFPDLLASTELIQVQRGAGSGVIGFPAVGGSINIITSPFSDAAKINLAFSIGSYNTRKYSAAFSSGLIENKYSIYAKLSQTLSSGYRNSSWAKFNSYHLSAVRYDDKLTSQLNIFGGPISDGLAYTGIAKFAVKDKKLRRDNYSFWEADENEYTFTLNRRPDEIENFSQPHYELLNEFKVSENIKLNSALFLVFGKGFFDFDGSWADTSYLRLTAANGFNNIDNPNNVLIRAQVENSQYGWIPRISLSHHNGELIIGSEIRIHKSNHWGSINFGENLPAGLAKDFRYYFFNGSKNIFNGFVHESYNINDKINLLIEIQLAYHKYRIFNERFEGNDFTISDVFFNPRFAINYKINSMQNIFLSFARVTREPRLKNYYDAAESSGGAIPQFEINSDGSFDFDKPLVKPETINDFELGTSLNGNSFSLNLNLFYMLFDNEIVNNGKLDRFGQPITGNVDRTIHTGIELSTVIKFFDYFEFHGNATYSKNEIRNGKHFINDSEVIDISGNDIGGFPEFLSNIGLQFEREGIFVKLNAKYVGKYYSDNFDNNIRSYLNIFPGFLSYSDNVNDSYFVMDLFTSYNMSLFNALSNSKIYLQFNNIFDNLYSAHAIGQEFFPAAERNFIAGVQVGL